MRTLKLVPLLTGLFLVGIVQADEVTGQIQAGVEAYQQQDYQLAVDELNYAVAQIQEKLNAANSTLLPEPLPGWTADAVENTSAAMAMMGGGTNMERSYYRNGETVNISIIANSPMLSGMMAMFTNPMVMSSNPNMKPYRYKRHKGVKEVDGGNTRITLIMKGLVMIKVEGARLKDEKMLEQYLEAMDLKRIQGALLQ